MKEIKISLASSSKKRRNSFENTFSLLAKNDDDLKKSLAIDATDDEDIHQVLVTDEPENNNNINNTKKEEYPTPFIKRAFGPMEAGSIRGSIFAISSLALGMGCLGLPLRFSEMGLFWGLTFLTLGAIVAYWSLSIMIIAAEGSKEMDYSKLVYETLGSMPSVFLDISIILYIFGVLVFYQVVINQMLGDVICDFFYPKYSHDVFISEIWGKKYLKFPLMFGISSVLIPLCLLKDISKMRFASLFSVASLFYVIIVIVIETYWFYNYYRINIYNEKDPSTQANYFDLTKVFDYQMKIFLGFSTIFFSFTCQVGAFPVYKTLKNNISRRINKVFRRSILLDYGIYIVVGICGFLTAPVNSPSLIISRDAKQILNGDYFMLIGKLAICFNLMMSSPANYNAFRISFFQLVWNTSEISTKRNLIVTIIVIYIATLIGAVYSEITSYINLLGGFLSVIISYLMPGLIYIKTNINKNKYPISNWRNIGSLILMIVLCTIGWISGIETLLFSIIKKK